jgi:NADH dehydrogenase
VLVLGGTGFVGRSLCEMLVERSGGAGPRVVVPTRRSARGAGLRHLPTVDVIEADVHDERSLAALLAGCDAVVNLVAILHGNAGEFAHVHVDLPRRLAAACAATHVRRVVHVSALAADAGAPSLYLRSKAAGEAVLREAALELTVLRPSVIFGAQDRFLNLFARLQRWLPLLPLAGAQARFQPVWVHDVAEAIARCLEQRWTIGQVYECTGPRVYTLAELARLAGRLGGHERAVLPLPGALARLQAWLMEQAPGQPMMSRDNLDSMRVPSVAGGALPGLTQLGITPASIEAIAPAYLGSTPGRGRLNLWRARAGR